eukprot:7208351-Pyramimonas_sp.AAC.1
MRIGGGRQTGRRVMSRREDAHHQFPTAVTVRRRRCWRFRGRTFTRSVGRRPARQGGATRPPPLRRVEVRDQHWDGEWQIGSAETLRQACAETGQTRRGKARAQRQRFRGVYVNGARSSPTSWIRTERNRRQK